VERTELEGFDGKAQRDAENEWLVGLKAASPDQK
jgi:hypothetical protein